MKLKSVGSKLLLISLSSIVIVTVFVSLVMYSGNKTLLSSTLESETKLALDALLTKAEDFKASSLKIADSISLNAGVRAAVQSGDKRVISEAVQIALTNVGADTDIAAVVDASGTVLARTHSDVTDDSLASQPDIASALSGTASTAFEQGSEILFSICSAAPIKDDNGQIIGAVSVGYKLDNPNVVDDLKKLMGTEFTVFSNNVRISTTIQKDGARQTGTKLNEKIAAIVIAQKQSYYNEAEVLGAPFYTAYAPILDTSGEVVGIFFAGKNISAIRNAETNNLLMTYIFVIIFCIFTLIVGRVITSKVVVAPVKRMSELAVELAKGNLHTEIQDSKSSDEIGQLVNALKSTSTSLKLYVSDIELQLNKISSGDISGTITQEYEGDFIPIKTALIQITDSLNRTFTSVNQSAKQVNEGASQVSSAAQSLASGATEQASSIEELSSSIEKVSVEVKENDGNVKQAAVHMDETWQGVEESNRRMKQMLEAMDKISVSSTQISDIIKVIEDIASQTNLLALNAAIEAARAGAAGKGFAVVADEVRNLAAKSTESAKQTAALIKASMAAVSDGTQTASDTAQELSAVAAQTATVKGIIQKIRQASEEQAVAIEQITQGINQMSTVVQTNAAASEESAATSEELSAQAAMLEEEVGKFTLRGETVKEIKKVEKPVVQYSAPVIKTSEKPQAKPQKPQAKPIEAAATPAKKESHPSQTDMLSSTDFSKYN